MELTMISIICGLILGIGVSVPAQTITCPDGFTTHQQHCYKAEFLKATWVQARELCHAMGAHLATVDTQDKYTFIEGYVQTIHSSGFQATNHYYLGATDLDVFREFRWVNMATKFLFTHWARGEPNNYLGRGEHCVVYDAGERGWSDYPCHLQVNFICEM